MYNNIRNTVRPVLEGSKVTYNLFYETIGRIDLGEVSDADIKVMASDAESLKFCFKHSK